MDKQLQDYYEARFDMFASKGWTDLIDDASEMQKSLNQVMPIANEQDLFLRKGQLDVLNWLLNLKEASETSYAQLMTGVSGD